MAILIPTELAALRRAVGDGVVPITWDKSTINMATQGCEDVLEAQAFDAVAFVSETTVTNTRAQSVKTSLDAGEVPSNLVPVIEDYLVRNPPSVTTRSVDTGAIADFLRDNATVFSAAVSAMPGPMRDRVVGLVIRRRVEAVV